MHGFYAGMGGFIFNLTAFPTDEAVRHVTENLRLTLTARGVALLAQCGYLPKIRKEEIVDKSKTDRVAKLISCLQATWMLMQIIERLALGLPVTLLEVNTLGHVLCALVIYVLWWHKPQLISEPTELKGDWVGPIAAYMYMSSTISGHKSKNPGLLRHSWMEAEFSTLIYVPQEPALTSNDNSANFEHNDAKSPSPSAFRKSISVSKIDSSTEDPTDAHSGHSTLESSTGMDSNPRRGSMAGFFKFRPEISDVLNATSHKMNPQADLERLENPESIEGSRWALAAEAMHRHKAIRRRVQSRQLQDAGEDVTWLEPHTEELVTQSAPNWPSEDLLRGVGGLIMGMVLWFATMGFGGVHASAWNDSFPSITEAWMWRFSSVFITASGLIWLLINWLAHQWKAIDNYWNSILALRAHWMSYGVLGTICSLCGVAYLSARAFLIVEAFISIRQLPVAAYQTPNWT